MKLYEVMSKSYGAKFKIKVGGIIKELTLGRMNANVMAELESNGISMEKFEEHMRDKLATNSTLIGWMLLKEKDEFNNDLSIFRECLDMNNIVSLSEAIFTSFEDAVPSEKNDEGPAT